MYTGSETHSSAGKELASQTEFGTQSSCRKLGMVACTCKATAREAEAGLSVSSAQPSPKSQ